MLSLLPSLIAVDVGNSRLKLGRYNRSVQGERSSFSPSEAPTWTGLPEPVDTVECSWTSSGIKDQERLTAWLAAQSLSQVDAIVGSVNEPAASEIMRSIDRHASHNSLACRVERLSWDQLPLEMQVDAPERVGIDRLAAAVAANILRRKDRAALVVDVGTAITIDLLSAEGVFEGGAIFPGIRMAARALHEQTHALPDCTVETLEVSPDAVGKSTESAIQAGLFWGAVGAIREIIARQRDRLPYPPDIYLTGGAAPSIACLLAEPDCVTRYVPHLVLSGLVLAAGA